MELGETDPESLPMCRQNCPEGSPGGLQSLASTLELRQWLMRSYPRRTVRLTAPGPHGDTNTPGLRLIIQYFHVPVAARNLWSRYSVSRIAATSLCLEDDGNNARQFFAWRFKREAQRG
jgi:hypothetical protein